MIVMLLMKYEYGYRHTHTHVHTHCIIKKLADPGRRGRLRLTAPSFSLVVPLVGDASWKPWKLGLALFSKGEPGETAKCLRNTFIVAPMSARAEFGGDEGGGLGGGPGWG